MKALMGWIPKTHQWQKRYNGKLYKVGCVTLGAPNTRTGSMRAANAWWKAKEKEVRPGTEREQQAVVLITRFLKILPSTVLSKKSCKALVSQAKEWLNEVHS